jgi:DnaK suppressor protein
MPTTLTSGQRAMIEADLRARLAEVERRLAARQEGGSRTEHASAFLEQDADDAPQRSADREVDLALSDAGMQELGELSSALQRLHDDDFGFCSQCGVQIPFDRLKIEPQALRCVACESAAEAAAGTSARSTL